MTGAINDSLTVTATLRLRPHFSDGKFAIDQRYVHKCPAFEFDKSSPQADR